ncbi:MAG: DUF2791 family P-loop domain-containing protein, partial [Dehalococcoidia bacterium]|nr:DUF2791 family P-loop domain-containing protein [Dehalococcoidia bacterium]
MDKLSRDLSTKSALRRPLGPGGASPFVGRDGELSRLREALSFIAEGQGVTIFLTGQPGVGKTRLAKEALALAKGRGFIVLEGRAFPLQGGLAYTPLVDALRPLLRSYDSARLATLVSGLPDLGRLFGSLNLPIPQPLGDPALE